MQSFKQIDDPGFGLHFTHKVKTMKRIGLIGGMSWASSHVYYQLLNQRVQSLLGGAHSCHCIMVSVDFAEIERLTFQDDWEGIGRLMAKSARELEAAGAELIILCTNTIHLVSDAITAATSLPFLHIADATGQAIKAQNMRKVALLGTRFTMEQDFYRDILEKDFGIEVIIPGVTDREALQHMIYKEMAQDRFTEEARQSCLRIIADMAAQGAEGAILGCTELPILLEGQSLAIPGINTTQEHAHAALKIALGQD